MTRMTHIPPPPTNQAHFSIKPEWLEGQYINSTTYSDLVFGATNELDWPHKSWCLACSSLDRPIKKERTTGSHVCRVCVVCRV
jgi:hypothetical protein